MVSWTVLLTAALAGLTLSKCNRQSFKRQCWEIQALALVWIHKVSDFRQNHCIVMLFLTVIEKFLSYGKDLGHICMKDEEDQWPAVLWVVMWPDTQTAAINGETQTNTEIITGINYPALFIRPLEMDWPCEITSFFLFFCKFAKSSHLVFASSCLECRMRFKAFYYNAALLKSEKEMLS